MNDLDSTKKIVDQLKKIENHLDDTDLKKEINEHIGNLNKRVQNEKKTTKKLTRKKNKK